MIARHEHTLGQKSVFMTLPARQHALRNIREQAFAPGSARRFATDRLITVCGNERGFMYAPFSCSDNLNLTSPERSAVSATRHFIYNNHALVSETLLLTSPTKILSAQPPVSDGLSPSSNYQLAYYLS